MKRYVHIRGKIQFNPPDSTTKHHKQASWKRMVIINIPGETHLLYNWFINRRYSFTLNPPLRGTHLSLVNDSVRDFKDPKIWDIMKQKWDGVEIDIHYDVDVKSNGKHWYMKVAPETEELLDSIRAELTLGKPYYSYHITIGHANERNIDQSEYIFSMIRKGFINS